MIDIYAGNTLINIIGLMVCREFRLNRFCGILYRRYFTEFKFKKKPFKFTCEATLKIETKMIHQYNRPTIIILKLAFIVYNASFFVVVREYIA